jgi:hypothetical protein
MKVNQFVAVLEVAAMLMFIPTTLEAGDYTFTTNNDTITITKYSGTASNVAIPNAIGVLPVTGIGDYAFSSCGTITNVTIPNSVSNIGLKAFNLCPSLVAIEVDSQNDFYSSLNGVLFNKTRTTLIQYPGGQSGGYAIPGTVTTIGEWAFADCYQLSSVLITNGVTTIGEGAFLGDNFGEVKLPESVTNVARKAFAYSTSLWSINVDSLNQYYTSVDGVLFNKGLTELVQCPGSRAGFYVIPEGVERIGDYAFAYCYRLGTITIPSTVTSVGDGAFVLSGLNSLTLPEGATSIGISAFDNCRSLSQAAIPNTVTNIGQRAFAACFNLKGITIPTSLARIEDEMFYASGLATVSIPTNVTSIGASAFGNCSSLTQVEIPNSVTNIGDEAFFNCGSLKDITIPASLGSIGQWVFNQCGSLTSVTIPEGVSSIGFNAFSACGSLTNVTMPESLTSIGKGAFSSCSSLLEARIPAGVTNLGSQAFFFCRGLRKVVLPERTASIDRLTFMRCESLTSVVIPAAVTNIGVSAFESCTSLTNVTIAGSLVSISDSAFRSCAGLTQIVLPDSLENIGSMAFQFCAKLPGIMIPENVLSIGASAFDACSSLEAIEVNPENDAYSSKDGVLFDKGQTTLIRCPQAKAGYYAIPDGVTIIAPTAFSGCSNLESIEIPKSVNSIGSKAFNGCPALSSIIVHELNSAYSSSGAALFNKDKTAIIKLSQTFTGGFVVPETVSDIQYGAFDGCVELTSVTMGPTVTNVGYTAFFRCAHLKGVYFLGDAPSKWMSPFDNTSTTTIYYLPGTQGWTSSFASRPTAQWSLPYPLLLGPKIGLGGTNDGFRFRISWATNIPVVVEASQTMSNPQWEAVSTNTLTGGWTDFNEPLWTNYSGRFYRVLSK